MLELDLCDEQPFGTKIKVIGVGGAGGNAVNTMIENGLSGIEFVVINTDVSDLRKSQAGDTLQIGKEATRGLGAGSNPEIGKKSAEESIDEIRARLEGTDMIFIAAGMGGGTGTGAAPFIAEIAKDMDILSIGIVNSPFEWEGKKRIMNAERGISELKEYVDSLMVIPNEKLLKTYQNLGFKECFKKADNILYDAVKAISEIIHFSGYINVDFADVRTVMQRKGLALMGIGMASGEDRAQKAAEMAMSNPLLDDLTLDNTQGVLLNITAGNDFKMSEFQTISEIITNATGDDGDIIPGVVTDVELEGKIKVTFIATGLGSKSHSSTIRPHRGMNSERNKSEELSETISRIRDTEKLNISRKQNSDSNPTNHKTKSTIQKEIPAFMRKFSN
jgi:cell division protein FtsZ